jgi:hypothetical protein
LGHQSREENLEIAAAAVVAVEFGFLKHFLLLIKDQTCIHR